MNEHLEYRLRQKGKLFTSWRKRGARFFIQERLEGAPAIVGLSLEFRWVEDEP